MTTTEQDGTGWLATYLAPMLARISEERDRPSEGSGKDQLNGVDKAVLLELEHLLAENPDLLPPDDPGDCERERAVSARLEHALDQRSDHSREVLMTLLAGREAGGPPAEGNRPGARDDPRRRPLDLLGKAWVRRQVAGLWMNALIALVLGLAWWLAWPPAGGWSGNLALGVFAVWCLSFLPGWLYVRFLGQRAGALWDEYVLSLHRLGWDRPRNLPQPLVTSDYFAEWFADGGPLLVHRPTIYRQKFDAYYGKSVSESSHRPGHPVKIETLFPVFLTTAAVAVCWVAVLWDLSFLTQPTNVWDLLKFGFMGSYLFILQMLIRRFFQSDLRPSAYATAMLRIITVLLVVAALHQAVAAAQWRYEAVAAFVIGFFPLVGMQALARIATATLRTAVPSSSPPYPLSQIDGLSVWYEARLLEEGIEDMQSLATANFVDVILHTRVPVGRLVDWVDQAHLYLHLDRMERGWLDRLLHGDKESVDTDTVAGGSVDEKSRAGTRTRTVLRQLGVRKATDLIKAFPPDQMQPGMVQSGSTGWGSHLAGIVEESLKLDQLRTLVRVLSQESALVPVWNWQGRGVQPATTSQPAGLVTHISR
jgi:hypothetical protein